MIFTNLLLAFQLENYMNIRFLKFIYTHPKFWFTGSKRQALEYTSKAKLILLLATIFFAADIFGSFYLFSGYFQFGAILTTVFTLPLYFVIANIIIIPIDKYLKNRIISKAKAKIAEYPNLKIIGITGSMGKTTTKEFLYTILSKKYKVLTTKGTKNTPLGISRVILGELDESHEIFIVEMGAYEKGNIAELCAITKPNISIITGITLQHLERFGSLDDIIDTKFEIIQALGKDDLAIIDISTSGAKQGLENKKFEVKSIIQIEKGRDFKYKENFGGIKFELEGETIDTKILSNYVVETLQICFHVAKNLGMNISEFNARVKEIDFVEHRMQLIHNTKSNVYVIDDSFNGNIEGIKSILHLMKNTSFSGRKILVAGGVVELGNQSYRVNYELGKEISYAADVVLIVEGPVGNAIEAGLSEMNFGGSNIKKYSSPLALHDDLKNITQRGDMIIFQNDLPDTYL